jgi:hypothetical protein
MKTLKQLWLEYSLWWNWVCVKHGRMPNAYNLSASRYCPKCDADYKALRESKFKEKMQRWQELEKQ